MLYFLLSWKWQPMTAAVWSVEDHRSSDQRLIPAWEDLARDELDAVFGCRLFANSERKLNTIQGFIDLLTK